VGPTMTRPIHTCFAKDLLSACQFTETVCYRASKDAPACVYNKWNSNSSKILVAMETAKEAAFDEAVIFRRYQFYDYTKRKRQKYVLMTAGAARALAAEISESQPDVDQIFVQRLAFAPVAVAKEEWVEPSIKASRAYQILLRLRGK
jgi:hypothetical protein